MCWVVCFTDQQTELRLSGFLLSFRISISYPTASGGNLKFIINVAQIRTSHTQATDIFSGRCGGDFIKTSLIVCLPLGQLVI